MYSYTFDIQTGGILLNSTPTNFSKEPRPVYAQEMDILGFDQYWEYEKQNDVPYMWAESNLYWYRGVQIAKIKGGDLYTKPELQPAVNENGIIPFNKESGCVLEKIDIPAMCKANAELMQVIEDSTVKRIVKAYEKYKNKLDIFHVAFSGGKDSAVLLDLVKKALPKDSFVVIFGDTGMEFPDTYDVVKKTQEQCEKDGTHFYIAKSHFNPEDSWKIFGPPARVLRWCCSVHKSTPQTIKMREITQKQNYTGMDFVGVRAYESVARSKYEYENFGKKQKGQYSYNPILEWTSAEVWLYIYINNLLVNETYKKGNSRAGCLFCPMGGGRGDYLQYMKKYVFSTTVLQQELTDYFEEYKKQKITNKINPQFLEIVNDNAKSYKYAKLPTRNSVINGIKDKNSVHLHWVDALGVEYLSFITEIARKKGISLQVEIARADLPTITVINKSFYDNWTGKSKEKEERLDEIKHKQQGGYLFTDSKEPIHLAAELGIIEEVMQKAETSLAMRECSKFVIASDHGASRLAVIKEQEVKYETDTKGEHSGRCCKYFDGCDLEYCIPENEYLVLSDYGRFKGSRKANVEVHGGATWEEIIVPIITLSLKNQEEVEIKVLDADNIFIEKNKGVLVKVYISDTSGANEVAIVCEGKKYIGQKEDATHYNFCISGIKRAKKYKATVYNGDDLIGEIEFTAKSKTGSVNTEFDDLF